MKDKFIESLLSLILGIGAILLASPLFLYWWIHGDYDRTIWIINGPYPYSHFGGGPFQLAMGLWLILGGIVMVAIYFIGKKLYNKSKINKL